MRDLGQVRWPFEKPLLWTGVVLALMAGLSSSAAAEGDAQPTGSHTVTIRATSEEMIATKDVRPEASQACSPGFVPTILTQASQWTPSVDVPTAFLFAPSNRVLIRRGTEKTLSSTDGSSFTDITEARVRYGVLHRSREEEAIYQNASVDLTLYGCFSPYSVQITAGNISIAGRAEAYSIQMDETLQSLDQDHGANLSIWYVSYVEALRLGDGDAYDPFRNSRWSDHELEELGRIRLTSEPIPWDYTAIEGDGRTLSGWINLSFSAPIFDGGVFNTTE